MRNSLSNLQCDWSGTTLIFKISISTIYSLPVISRTRMLVDACGILSLINTDGSIPALKTLQGKIFHQTLHRAARRFWIQTTVLPTVHQHLSLVPGKYGSTDRQIMDYNVKVYWNRARYCIQLLSHLCFHHSRKEHCAIEMSMSHHSFVVNYVMHVIR